MSQEKLADCMGTSKSVISELENGRRRWNEDHIYKAAQCLSCRPSQLITTDPNKDAPLEELLAQVPEADRPRVRQIIEAFLPNDEITRKPKS